MYKEYLWSLLRGIVGKFDNNDSYTTWSTGSRRGYWLYIMNLFYRHSLAFKPARWTSRNKIVRERGNQRIRMSEQLWVETGVALSLTVVLFRFLNLCGVCHLPVIKSVPGRCWLARLNGTYSWGVGNTPNLNGIIPLGVLRVTHTVSCYQRYPAGGGWHFRCFVGNNEQKIT